MDSDSEARPGWLRAKILQDAISIDPTTDMPILDPVETAPNPQGGAAGGGQWVQRPRRRLVFPLLGGLATVIATGAGFFTGAGISWLDSVCNDDPSVVASHTHSLRISLLVVWLLVSIVPLICTAIARQKRRIAWPWAVVSGLLIGVAIVMAMTAKPTTWCLF